MQNRPPSERLRVLLTDAGSIGRRHARNVRALVPDAEMLAVCHSDATRHWAGEFGVTPVPSVAVGLEAKPRIAVVCSVSASHAQDLALLMPAVDALYIEKPLVTDPAGLASLRRFLDAGWDKPSVVGCNLRYLGAVQKLKQAYQAGEAGRVACASLCVGQWLPDWRAGRDYRESYSARRAQGGGVLFDLVHELDSACFLFGEIARGQAAAGRGSGLDIDADHAAAITLLMKSGLPVQVGLDYVSRRAVREYRLVGDAATLRLDLTARELSRVGPEGTTALPTGPADWDMAGTYLLAMQDLLTACASSTPTRYSLREAMHVTGWMIDLEAAAWRNGPAEVVAA